MNKGDGVIQRMEPLSLESVAEGAAETMFQDELVAVQEMFETPQNWADSAGVITATITLKVALTYDLESKTTQAEVSSSLKRPSRLGIRRPVFRGDDGWSAVFEAKQKPLFGADAEGGEGQHGNKQ